MNNFLELWTAGGIFLYPIAIASFVSLVLTMDRYILISNQSKYDKSALNAMLQSNNLSGCVSYASDKKDVFFRLLEGICYLYIDEECRDRDVFKSRVEELGKEQFSVLENNMVWIGLIANIAPMMGLMGTVWGMIITFKAIESVGLGSISGLAGGISQALITTLAGLAVGIPSLMFYRLLDRKLDTLSVQMERDILACVDILLIEEDAKKDVVS
jgi:biopolymer transport protein ExbB